MAEVRNVKVLEICSRPPVDGEEDPKDVQDVKVLLAAAGDHSKSAASATDAHGTSALSHASEHGKEDVVQALLDAGADVNGSNLLGETPLHFASRGGHPAVVAKLLAIPGVKFDPVVTTLGHDWTPLLEAAHGGHGDRSLEVAKLLLAKGANPYQKDSLGRDVIQLSTSEALKELFREEGC
jgi:uncharacterized protein